MEAGTEIIPIQNQKIKVSVIKTAGDIKEYLQALDDEECAEEKNRRIQYLVENSIVIDFQDYIHRGEIGYSRRQIRKNAICLSRTNKRAFFSTTDELPKYSAGYKNCTGIVAFGTDAGTGKNISFLTHQHTDFPHFFGEFGEELGSSLQDLKKRSKEGSIGITILGGDDRTRYTQDYDEYGRPGETAKGERYTEYIRSIDAINRIIFETLGISPRVAGGISHVEGVSRTFNNSKTILVDTQAREIFYFRRVSKTELETEFVADDIRKILHAPHLY